MNPSERYAERLKSPLWRLKRLDVLEAADFTCARCKASGVQLEAHHTHYVADREPWEYPLSELECLCHSCHSEHHGIEQTTLDFARQIVQTFATRFTMPRRPKRPDFDAARIQAWARRNVMSGPPQRAIMKFAAWLWKTGTQDMNMIVQLLDEALRRNPDSWYAYFAPGGPARECRTDQVAIEHSEADSNAHKAAERAFLSEPKP